MGAMGQPRHEWEVWRMGAMGHGPWAFAGCGFVSCGQDSLLGDRTGGRLSGDDNVALGRPSSSRLR